tara:strand:- start:351 stop:485 length:135 start_codon:yes stop_codon:yes gene_type:complete
MNDAVLAGITAWVIEVAIAIFMFMLLRREENKVYERRKNKRLEK